jgi:hypothetical protein
MLFITLFIMSLINKRSKPAAVPVRGNSIPRKLPVDDRSW